ncbi:hypothetical protein XENTR_v10023783 [Xenopus tropicalis]|nr:hypothetical protein XENTR_v10023783 [Xenopus tropicalis]
MAGGIHSPLSVPSEAADFSLAAVCSPLIHRHSIVQIPRPDFHYLNKRPILPPPPSVWIFIPTAWLSHFATDRCSQ